ncbi:MAG: hypothetical protein ACKO3K_01775 [Cuspidothrix sp.]
MLLKIVNTQLLLFGLSCTLSLIIPILDQSNIAVAQTIAKSSEFIISQQIVVDNTEFGVKIINSNGKANFFPTNKVPLKQGDAYGWRIKLDNYQGQVRWREVLTLPKPPETWITQDDQNFSISKDGKTAISQRTETPMNGVIENFWTISPGDPVGQHQIEIYTDQRLIARFEFEIVPF